MHFVASKNMFAARSVQRPWAAVSVEVLKGGKILQVKTGSICVIKSDAMIVPLPKTIRVVSDEGEESTPTWGFWVTTETFDPWHLLLDLNPMP